MTHRGSRGSGVPEAARRHPRWRATPATLALASLLMACDPPPAPSSQPAPGNPAPAALITTTAAVCDQKNVVITGVVVERTPAGTQPIADVLVHGRFPPEPYDPAAGERTDAGGRYRFCRAVPEASCGSGACSLPFEIRAGTEGYVTSSTTLTVTYNAWWFNDFEAPDLELVPD